MVSTVIILHQPHRQIGAKNARFLQLLFHLHEGRCTTEDFDLLNSRVVTNANRIDFTTSPWHHIPIIIYDNASKDVLNEKATAAFAQETSQQLQWYYSDDKLQRSSVKDTALIEHLTHLHLGITQQRLGHIPLVLGMPVLVSQNFDVEGGIVNGSYGTVQHIRYCLDENRHRHLLSVIVHIPDSSEEPLENLPPHDLPILEDTKTIKFMHPYSNKSCNLQWHQIPILPGFAMTAHHAQGQMMDCVIVDLQSCRGTEAPYVMISRACSLEGLLIL